MICSKKKIGRITETVAQSVSAIPPDQVLLYQPGWGAATKKTAILLGKYRFYFWLIPPYFNNSNNMTTGVFAWMLCRWPVGM